MTIIWLARHAETATPHLIHGAESDVGLGEHGRRQAAAAAPWFRERGIEVVVSSGMLRARQTAEPIVALCGVSHEIEPELHERQVGPFSQKGSPEVETVWADTIRHWEAGDAEYSHPEMESFAAIARRVVPPFERIAARHAGRRLAVIAHGVVCKVLLLSLLDDQGSANWMRLGRALNLSVSKLVHERGRWQVNDLLAVPPPVMEVNQSRIVDGGRRSEA